MRRLIPIILLYAPIAWSQCAPGIPSAGNPGCIPPDAPGSPYQNGSQQQAPKVQWADRWGAIAIDGDTGGAGAVVALPSREAAVSAAIQDCAKNGSRNCSVRMAYKNQCAAVAWGGGFSSTARAPTKEAAEADATATCEKSGAACKVVYSDCSYPVRVN
jgi:hypothetical protein